MVSTLGRMAKSTNTVRLRPDFIRRLGRLAGHHGKSTPDYLAEVLGPVLDEADKQMAKDLDLELKAPARPAAVRKSSRRGETAP
jgi:predicted DNA-binding protein